MGWFGKGFNGGIYYAYKPQEKVWTFRLYVSFTFNQSLLNGIIL